MSRADSFSIGAIWQRRGETAAQIFKRTLTFIDLASPALPPDLKWYISEDLLETAFVVQDDPDRLLRLAEAGIYKDEIDETAPSFGWHFKMFLCPESPVINRGRCASLKVSAGANAFHNTAIFFANHVDGLPDPRLLTFDVMKANMMAIVWAFRPEWCTASPSILDDYLDGEVYARPYIGLAWMTWLEAALFKQMQLPPRHWNLILEAYSDGSVFMATSKRTFSVEDRRDLPQARAIHRQLDHLNYIVPFEGMSGRSTRVPPFPKIE